MTDVEKTIYGVAFARSYLKDIASPPPRCLLPGDEASAEWEKHELESAAIAAEGAAYAVQRLRDVENSMRESWDGDDDVLRLYLETIGKGAPIRWSCPHCGLRHTEEDGGATCRECGRAVVERVGS